MENVANVTVACLILAQDQMVHFNLTQKLDLKETLQWLGGWVKGQGDMAATYFPCNSPTVKYMNSTTH